MNADAVADDDDPTAVLASDAFSGEAKRLLGLYDIPAFLRRAIRTTDALERFWSAALRQRAEWLDPVRMRVRHWRHSAGRHGTGGLPLRDGQLAGLRILMAELLPPDWSAPAWAKPPAPSAAFRELAESVKRFNQRWDRYLAALDIEPVNRVIAGYNANYLLEKECVIHSAKVAAHGFTPLTPLSRAVVEAKLPMLPELTA